MLSLSWKIVSDRGGGDLVLHAVTDYSVIKKPEALTTNTLVND